MIVSRSWRTSGEVQAQQDFGRRYGDPPSLFNADLFSGDPKSGLDFSNESGEAEPCRYNVARCLEARLAQGAAVRSMICKARAPTVA
jgi:hypothetical protein